MHSGLISWLIVGLIAGWLGGKITRGKGFGLIADKKNGFSLSLVLCSGASEQLLIGAIRADHKRFPPD